MGNKVSPKQIQAYLQEESKSIEYQKIIFKINISEDIRNIGPPTKVQVDFAWADSMNSIVWNHEVCSCLLKIEKTMKNKRKEWKCMPEGKWQQKIIEI